MITPTLGSLLDAMVRSGAEGIRVAIPCEVVSYDGAARTAKVKPMIPDVTEGGLEDLPEIAEVPVAWPRGGGMILAFPLAVGDTGLLVFSDRSIREWRRTGLSVDPRDPIAHTLQGAVFFPGLATAKTGTAYSSAVLGVDGGLRIEVDEGQDEIRLGADATDFVALKSQVDALADAFDIHVHATAGTGTPSPPTPVGGVIPVTAVVDAAAATRVKAE